MEEHYIYVRATSIDRVNGVAVMVCGGFMSSLLLFSVIGDSWSWLVLLPLGGMIWLVVIGWMLQKTRTYAYENRIGLRYLNALHGIRWKWGEEQERIIKHVMRFDPKKDVEKGTQQSEYLNIQDVEVYGLSHFIERLQQGKEHIEISLLTQAQRTNLVFDFQVLGTEFQRQSEKVKRTLEDSALATRYQHLALYCQKESKRLEGSIVGVVDEVTTLSAEQGEVEELPNISGSVRLLRQEGRVSELRFYGLPHGEYTVIIGNRMKTIQIEDGAKALALSEMEAAPVAHGAFMINTPDGKSDAVRW